MTARQKKPLLTGITGGIGSGKSVVCRILRTMGYDVYDCDSRAKALMDSSPEIRKRLTRVFGNDIFSDRGLDRARLGEMVFGNEDLLRSLNEIVHGAVLDDIKEWTKTVDAEKAFVETAILFGSGLDRLVDRVWTVTAPRATRIERVARRNGLTTQQIVSRIEAQSAETTKTHPNTNYIENDGLTPLLPRILTLLKT